MGVPPDPALPLKDQAEAAGTEEYATSHVALVEHPVPLLPSRAAYILDQLVSVTRDCLHAGRVCHRDLKGENVLVDVNTGEILVLGRSPVTDCDCVAPVPFADGVRPRSCDTLLHERSQTDNLLWLARLPRESSSIRGFTPLR